MSFIKIQSLFSDSLKRNHLEKGVNDTQILKACQQALGEIFGATCELKAKPITYKNRAVRISVLSSVFKSQIKLKESEVVSLINKKLHKKVVDRLILRQD